MDKRILINLLLTKYPDASWSELLHLFKPFKKIDIIKKASDLGIRRKLNSLYSQQELEILITNYSILSTKKLMLLLPFRTESSIHSKASKLGLVSREKWDQYSLQLLSKVYENTSNKKIQSTHFPHRSISAIQYAGTELLGIKKDIKSNARISKELRKKNALIKLKEYANELKNTPTSREVQNNKEIPGIATYNRYFDSYAKACGLVGLEVNLSLFGKSHKVYYSSKGHICYSKSELSITEILINNLVVFEKEVLYQNILPHVDCGQKRCDWYIDNKVIVEFFGMPEKDYYAVRMDNKIELCDNNSIPLIKLFREDIDRKDKWRLVNKFKQHGINIFA